MQTRLVLALFVAVTVVGGLLFGADYAWRMESTKLRESAPPQALLQQRSPAAGERGTSDKSRAAVAIPSERTWDERGPGHRGDHLLVGKWRDSDGVVHYGDSIPENAVGAKALAVNPDVNVIQGPRIDRQPSVASPHRSASAPKRT